MTAPTPQLLRPATLAEAVHELDRLGSDGAPLAGATWVMRAPQRREPLAAGYVSLLGLAELRDRMTAGTTATLGSLLTHAELAVLDPAAAGPLGALARAARICAFPAVNSTATLGGGICARGFAESDLVPALLALGAEVELARVDGPSRLALDAYLDDRPAGIVVRVHIPAPAGLRSAYERLTVRGGGEYPLCGVAVATTLDTAGRIASARVAAVGLDTRARLLPAAAAALVGLEPTDGAAVLAAGAAGIVGLPPRDGADAPGWYRLAVLPALLRDAVARLAGTGPQP